MQYNIINLSASKKKCRRCNLLFPVSCDTCKVKTEILIKTAIKQEARRPQTGEHRNHFFGFPLAIGPLLLSDNVQIALAG
jgi:hypothetical protein